MMTAATEPSCHTRDIDAHFAGRASLARERAMRAHIASCARCRDRYERHLLLARLDPAALNGRARLAIGLGLRLQAVGAPGLSVRRWWSVPALAAAGAACIALLALAPRSGFHSRGGRGLLLESGLAVYRVGRGRPMPLNAPDRAAMAPDDELAFAYRNPEGYRTLLVYGVDEHGHVYWYFPAWRDESANPAGVPIAAGPALRELGEAVSHPLDGHELRLFGLFTNRPLTVREVEMNLAAVGNAAVPPVVAEGRLFRLDLRVARRTAP